MSGKFAYLNEPTEPRPLRIGQHKAEYKAPQLYTLAHGSHKIAIVEISGVLMPNDGLCGQVGTANLTAYISDLANDAAINGIILLIDSPGGMVSGTETLANAVRAAAARKPVIAHVASTACSAAYWIAAAATKVVAGERTAIIGSIGVMMTIDDFTKQREMNGVQRHEILSDLNPDKNQDFMQAIKGTYQRIKDFLLNPTANVFHASVKQYRPMVNPEALTGATYTATRAQELGLIDSVGTFDDAVNLITGKQPQTSYTPTPQPQPQKQVQNAYAPATLPTAETLQPYAMTVPANIHAALPQYQAPAQQPPALRHVYAGTEFAYLLTEKPIPEDVKQAITAQKEELMKEQPLKFSGTDWAKKTMGYGGLQL